ncbi:tRNA (32-2'-O)-methyltransferase regulator THADA isoform X2 [Bacillus rossius redtenbacheri]|uniref:tRNA (32-2'-O)-methyltransferase regulator THADA isoform X2 n=1 Tax=Bacillus rossius redtenbacheri TaxID=93214 RepID=UPI002FDEC170
MDFLPVVKDDNVELPVQNVTAQMLLLCSWRTVKEVSLFLGELSERAPIITEGSPESGLMTEEQVLAIGEHFTALLSETKHRGAFEQAYVGFCQLCSRLWGHPAGRLHRLPAAWLAELMALIAEGGGGVLCATRRSAGVPFMVQALVTTQLQAGGGPGCFQQSMSALLSLAGRAAGGAEARAHAFNILRALFRYSALGELVTPYVAEGVMVAVRGFRGSTWAERNAATLLFGALITRIFGVPRSKDEKLRMTGRVFFHRYPQLFDFLLEELQNITATMAQDSIDAPQLYPSLYPVLVLLSRLYPSSLEGSDSKLQLKVYVPHVMACGHSCMVHTRILAARALVPLVTPNVFVTYVSQMFREVSATQGVLQNRRHGLLLQIVHLLQGASHTGTVGDEVRLMVDAWVAKSEWLLLARAGISLVTQETYLRVLTLLGADYFSSIQAATWLKFYEHLERVVFGNTALCGMIGKPVFEKTATSLLLQIAVSMDTEPRDISQRLGKILVRLLEHPEVEVVMSALRFVLGIFDNVDEAGGEDEDLGLVQVRSWNPSNKLQLMDEIRLHAELLQAVADLALRDSMYPPCRRLVFRLLYHCREAFLMARWHDVDKSDLLLRLCSEEHENVSYTVLLSLGAFMLVHQEHKRELPISSEQASKMCQILLEFSSPEKPQLCRHSAAKVLLQNSYLLSETVPFLSGRRGGRAGRCRGPGRRGAALPGAARAGGAPQGPGAAGGLVRDGHVREGPRGLLGGAAGVEPGRRRGRRPGRPARGASVRQGGDEHVRGGGDGDGPVLPAPVPRGGAVRGGDPGGPPAGAVVP